MTTVRAWDVVTCYMFSECMTSCTREDVMDARYVKYVCCK